MADVFISYSKKSPEPTKLLATDLEAKGYQVWWDTRLISGQQFDDVIRDELEKADAVIVIWTSQSVKSNYVRMEAGIAWAWEKLIPVRVADLEVGEIPGPFREFQTDDVADFDRVILALESKGVTPPEDGKKTVEEIMEELGRLDASLPDRLRLWLLNCQKSRFRILTKKSIMIKSTVPNFGEGNFGTLFPDGTFQTNYISDSAERLGDPTIAAEYLNGVAGLIDGATVRRDGNPWTWRVEVFGELPKISSILARGDDWINLMKRTRKRFNEVAAAFALEQ